MANNNGNTNTDMSVNVQMSVQGVIGKIHDLSYTNSGRAVFKFGLGTSRYAGKDENGAAKYVTSWMDIVCWGDDAEAIYEAAAKAKEAKQICSVQIDTMPKTSVREHEGRTFVSLELAVNRASQVLFGDRIKRAGSGGGYPGEYSDADYPGSTDDIPF